MEHAHKAVIDNDLPVGFPAPVSKVDKLRMILRQPLICLAMSLLPFHEVQDAYGLHIKDT